MKIQDIFQSVGDRLQLGASVKAVYGEPIQAEGKTIIPVARISYGFGAGSGAHGAPGGDGETPEGAGGGGGLKAIPVGVVEVPREGEARFVPFSQAKLAVGALAAGFLLGFMLARR